MRTSQRGQALVGAMVIMLILFALAGGVAVAASGLLHQGRARGAAIADLSAQSAVADAISLVAGSSNQCTLQADGTGPFPDIDVFDLTTLRPAYPDPLSSTSTTALCARVDHVPVPLGGTPWSNLAWKSTCGTMQLPRQHVTTFFDARVNGAGGLLYVDDQSPATSCRTTLPGSALCSQTSPQPGCVMCGRTLNTNVPVIAQAALDCDLSGGKSAAYYLHVVNRSGLQSPAMAFTAGHSDTGGSIYLLATLVGPGNTYEEAVLLVPPGGAANQLLYKAAVP